MKILKQMVKVATMFLVCSLLTFSVACGEENKLDKSPFEMVYLHERNVRIVDNEIESNYQMYEYEITFTCPVSAYNEIVEFEFYNSANEQIWPGRIYYPTYYDPQYSNTKCTSRVFKNDIVHIQVYFASNEFKEIPRLLKAKLITYEDYYNPELVDNHFEYKYTEYYFNF